MSPIHGFNVKADVIWWWMSYCKSPGDLYFLIVSCLQNSNWRWNWFFHIGQQNAEESRGEEMLSLGQSKSWSFGIQYGWGYPCRFPKYVPIFSSRDFVPAEFGHFYHLSSLSGPVTCSLEPLHSNSNQVLSLSDRNGYDASMKHEITKIRCACVCKLH